MTPERWQQVKFALDQVLDAAPEMRASRLNEVCADDAELCGEVESLLAFEDTDDGSFTKSKFSAVIEEVFSDEADAFTGKQIGSYKILREIGVGGMGTVFLAERTDGEFDRQVAVKFLRQSFSSKSARQRFVQERQILARLQHRFIAQLIDGGTTADGTPYLVMEYVEGKPITEYCRENDLSIRAKLDLFRNVCEAVSFAHRNLIVHRDLKPDNILITADGIPKLLDFGIAKLLSNNEIKATVTRSQALTPDYAAPEQLAGRDVTTTSDVYALGIILYELLTQTHPFRRKNSDSEKLWQSAMADEPLRPSAAATRRRENPQTDIHATIAENKLQKTTRKILKGDLDTIILKALRREPERRYDSVERFSQDIKSYLKGFPISARPDTFRYRTGKFLKRNPLASAAVAIAVISLIGGIVIAAYQAHRANIERARAERRFNEVRALANSFMFEINEKIDESPIKARELLVSRAVEYLDNLAQEADNDPALQSELATSYEKIGDLQSEIFKPNLGKTSDALVSHRKSLEIRQKLFDDEPKNVGRGFDVVKSRLNIADILTMSGKIGEARDEYQKTVDFCRDLLTLDSQNFNVRRSLASGYARLGQSVLRSGSLSDALRNYDNSLASFQQLAVENPDDKTLQRSIDIVFSYIGYVKMKTGAMPQAVQYFADSLNIEEKLKETESSLPSRGSLSTAYLWYGVALSEADKPNEGIKYIRRSLDIQAKIFENDKNNFGEQNALADCFVEAAKASQKLGQIEQAAEYMRKAQENYQTVWENDRENLPTHCQIAQAQRFLGELSMQKGDNQKASENLQSALSAMKELTAYDPNNSEWQYDLAVCYARLGEYFLKKGDRPQASENLDKALPMLEQSAAKSPEDVYIERDLEKVRKLVISSRR